MGNVLLETWETGPAGSACSKSNTGWNQFINGFTFVADSLSGLGSLSGRIAPTATNAQAQRTFTARSAGYETIFLKQDGNPSVDVAIANMRGGGNTKLAAELRVLATGALQIRNAGYVAVAQSAAGMVPVGSWCRIEWLYNSATARQQVRLYKTDPLGSTPDYDSGSTATTAAGTVDAVSLGAVNSTTWSATFGDFNVDDATFPSYGTGSGAGGTVDAGPDKVIEPYGPGVTITATSTGAPTGWSWQQMSPPDADKQLALSGASTATVSVTARPDIVPVTYKLRPTATYASGSPAYDDVNVTILPATEHFVRDDGVHVPMLKQVIT